MIHKIKKKNAKIEKYDKINKLEKKISSLPNFSKDHFYFVSTDIVDSTRLWNTKPNYMRREIAYHHRVGSILIYQLDGYESKKEGDAYFAVFDNLINAVKFATEFQKLMMGRLSLRIGISKGEAIVVHVDERYLFLGNAATHANSVCDAGDADEILIDGYNYFSMNNNSS
ncbi:hypothetical protein BDAP_002520 [Binucleata daphniae]